MPEYNIAMGVGRREPLPRVGEIAKSVEDYGFKSLYIQDNPLTTKDSYMALTVAALNTERLLLGPGVSNPIVRHLAQIANGMFTLDHVSSGRAILGFGMGGPALVEPLGYPAKRLGDFREDLKNVRKLLRGEEVTGPGTARYRIPGIERPIPVYLAVRGPKMCEAAGMYADGALIGATHQPEVFETKVQIVREAAKKVGRDPSEVKICFLLNMAVDTEEQKGSNVLRPFVVSAVMELGPGSWEVPNKYDNIVKKIHEIHDPAGHLAANTPETALLTDEMVNDIAIAGSVSECRKRVRQLAAVGADEMTFTLMSGGRMERLRSIAEVVMS